jgi:hypothetical protein
MFRALRVLTSPLNSGAGSLFIDECRSSAMMANTVANWHRVVETRDAAGLNELLAENAVFHSPVVHTPQVGKAITHRYLTAAFGVLFNESFRYVREIVADHDAALEFVVEIDGITVNGVDLIAWDDDGRIVDFKVMLRPLKAINLIQQKMAAKLQAAK